MPTFIKPGYWNNKRKQLAGELDLDRLIQSFIPTTTSTTTLAPVTNSYKVFSALLTTTTGPNTLNVVVLENTIGIINWIISFGVSLQFDSGGLFTLGKTAVIFSNSPTGKSIGSVFYTNANNIQIAITDGYTTFNNTFIEIRVYN